MEINKIEVKVVEIVEIVEIVKEVEVIENADFATIFKKIISTDDMIPYDDIKDWIGYKRKKTIIEILNNDKYGYVENIDYKIIKEKKENICKPVNEIYDN